MLMDSLAYGIERSALSWEEEVSARIIGELKI